MALFSPALVVAMAVLFVLTRIHNHMFLFEVPLFFGLRYYLQPDKRVLDKLVNPTSSTSSSTVSGSASSSSTATNGASGSSSGSSTGHVTLSSRNKSMTSSLTLRRGMIGPSFFSSIVAEPPYLRHIHYLLSLCAAYAAALFLESILSCRYPALLLNSRSLYIALFTAGYALFQLWRISLFLSSLRVMLLFSGVSALLILIGLSAGGDGVGGVMEGQRAFRALRAALFILARSSRGGMAISGGDEGKAEILAGWGMAIGRAVVVGVAALAAASVVVPARRFSLLDFRARREFLAVSDAQSRTAAAAAAAAADACAPPVPSTSTLLRLAVDYAAPALAFFWVWLTPRSQKATPLAAWRVYVLLGAVAVRIAQARPRLQAYLDGAADAMRRPLRERGAAPSTDVARAVIRTVVGTSFYLPMLALAYVAPLVVPALLLGVAAFDGDTASFLPMCRPPQLVALHPARVFVAEVTMFFAWLILAAYLVFSVISFVTELAFDAAGLATPRKPHKLPAALTASERRRQKRLLQQQEHQKS